MTCLACHFRLTLYLAGPLFWAAERDILRKLKAELHTEPIKTDIHDWCLGESACSITLLMSCYLVVTEICALFSLT